MVKPSATMSRALTPKELSLTLVSLYALAFIARLIFLNQYQSMPSFDLPMMDEQYHLQIASMINSDAGMPAEPYFRAPLYLYFLAKVLLLTGGSLYWARFVQISIAALVPLLVFLVSRRFMSYRAALVSGGICALYPTLLFFDNSFLIESITGATILALCWQLYRSQDKPTTVNFALSGFLLGIAGLLRPNILPFGLALFLWVWFVIRPKLGVKLSLFRYVILGVVAFTTILPVTIRNRLVGHDNVLIAWQGGFNFYLGNNHAASGWAAAAPGLDLSWQGSYDDAIKIAERDAGHSLKRSEVSDYWYKRAYTEIAADPGSFIGLLTKKLRLFFNGEEIPNNQNTYLVREFVPILRLSLFRSPVYFPYGILAPLAIIGLVAVLSKWRQYLVIYLLIASYVATLLLFFVCDRYRQPVIPLLIVVAAAGVIHVRELVRKKSWRVLSVYGVALGLLFIESNHSLIGMPANIRESEDRYGLGCSYLDKGLLPEAEKEFQQSVEADPYHGLSLLNLGNIQRQRTDMQGALNYYLKAVDADSTLWQGYLSAAAACKRLGQRSRWLELLQRAREVAPENEYVHLELALAYSELGDFKKAKEFIAEAKRLNPSESRILQSYDYIMKLGGI